MIERLYSRTIPIDTACLTLDDIKALFNLIEQQRKVAEDIEVENRTFDLVDQATQLEREIREVFRISYAIGRSNRNRIEGYGLPSFSSDLFDSDLLNVFISTSDSFESHARFKPQNYINIFISFERVSLAINFLTMPSNPTARRSVINIDGLNEGWVIETHSRLREFFEKRKNKRAFLHGSGIYDIFLYAFTVPLGLVIMLNIEQNNETLFAELPRTSAIAIFIYAMVILALVSRLTFMYTRWLFPLVEYQQKGNWNPYIQRSILLMVMLSIAAAAVWDGVKNLIGMF